MITPKGRPDACWAGSYPSKPDQVAQVRRDLQDALADSAKVDAVLGAQLVSELATNAVVHSCGDTFGVIVIATAAGRVRVEVSDSGRGETMPQVRLPDSVAEGGRGLWLVSALAESWGVIPLTPNGFTVWFELAPEGQPVVAGMGSHDGR